MNKKIKGFKMVYKKPKIQSADDLIKEIRKESKPIFKKVFDEKEVENGNNIK